MSQLQDLQPSRPKPQWWGAQESQRWPKKLDYVSSSTVLSVKLKEANCQWPACNARTTATGTGSQVTLVAQAANGVAIAGVAPGGAVDVPVAWHALVAQVANHVLPAQTLPVLLAAVPSYRARPVTLARQASRSICGIPIVALDALVTLPACCVSSAPQALPSVTIATAWPAEIGIAATLTW